MQRKLLVKSNRLKERNSLPALMGFPEFPEFPEFPDNNEALAANSTLAREAHQRNTIQLGFEA